MEQVKSYLHQILRNSFLTKREKTEWMEEMQTHLNQSIEELVNQGYSKEQSIEKALEKFGTPDELRTRLTKETFGYRSSTIFYTCAIFLALFMLSLIIKETVPPEIHLFSSWIFKLLNLISTIFLTLFALTISLFITRKRVDRLCLIFTPMLFALADLQFNFSFLEQFGRQFQFLDFERLFYPGAFDAVVDTQSSLALIYIGNSFLLLNVLILFMICKNRFIAVAPFFLAITYKIFYIVSDKLHQLYLWLTHTPYNPPRFNSVDLTINGDFFRLTDIGINFVVALLVLMFFKYAARNPAMPARA